MTLTHEQIVDLSEWFIHLTPYKQARFLTSLLENGLTWEDIDDILNYVRWYTVFMNPEHFSTLKAYVGKELYKEMKEGG